MQGALLPLFPLQLVLFPRTPLPLHIFEDRYKEMIGEAMQSKSEFGVVQAGEKGVVNTGCTASIERVLKTYPDGRMDILTLGRRRFEIITLNDDRSYLRGEVEFFEDGDSQQAPRDLRVRAIESFSILKDLSDVHIFGTPEVDDPQLSFQIAQLVPDLDFRQTLLATRSESDRIRRLVEFFPNYIARLRKVAHAKTVAPRNGHSKLPADPS
jgi:ATP-dependent Lon protease